MIFSLYLAASHTYIHSDMYPMHLFIHLFIHLLLYVSLAASPASLPVTLSLFCSSQTRLKAYPRMSQLCFHFRAFVQALPIFWNARPVGVCTVCSYTLLRSSVPPQSYSLKYSSIPTSFYSLSPSSALFFIMAPLTSCYC